MAGASVKSAGRALDLQRDHVEFRTGSARELVDRCPAAGEVRYHLGGDLRREGGDALRGDTMRAGKNDDLYAFELRHVAALPAGQPRDQRLQTAEAALRLG